MRWLIVICSCLVLSDPVPGQTGTPQRPPASTPAPTPSRKPAAPAVRSVPVARRPAPVALRVSSAWPTTTQRAMPVPPARAAVSGPNQTAARPVIVRTTPAARPAPRLNAPTPSRPAATARRPVVYRRIYVPERHGDRPLAWGLDGLDVPIDRRTYAGPRSDLETGMNSLASLSSTIPGPENTMRLGNSYTVPIGGLYAPNPITGAQIYSLYTYSNSQGGTSSLLFDKATGGATQYNQSGSVGHTYYGALPPGVSPFTSTAPSVSFGNGVGSLSGLGSQPTVGNQGPFGGNYSQAPGFAGNNPISPTVGLGVYGIPASLQAPGFGTPN
jgi:hypothetical protein